MNQDVLKIAFAIMITILSGYICINVLTAEIKNSKTVTMAGTENSYWSKNKKNSLEAKKDRNMKVVVFLFLLAVVLGNLLF